jgi:mycothiol synthase
MMQPNESTQALKDLILRPVTLDDCAGVVDLLNACSRAVRGVDEFSVEGLRGEWEQPGFDLATSSLAAVDATGRIVGYIDVWDMEDPPVKPFVFGRVHPDYEGLGIGTRLMQWAEDRSRQVIDRVPPGVRVAMKAFTTPRHQSSMRLLQEMGLAPVRYSLEMRREFESAPEQPQWPVGISIHTHAEIDDAKAVYHTYHEAFQDHRDFVAGAEEQGFSLWLHRMTRDPDYDPSLWFLAMDGEEIAGVSLCKRVPSEDPDLGWVETLAVRRPWRRAGLGLALLLHAFAEFQRRGLRRAALSVDAASLTGATRLYQRAGMTVKEEYAILEKELRPGLDLTVQSISE